jgi:hypothetical protein
MVLTGEYGPPEVLDIEELSPAKLTHHLAKMKETKPSFLDRLPEMILEMVEADEAAVLGGAVRAEFDATLTPDIDVFVYSQEKHRRLVGMVHAVEVPGTYGLVYTAQFDGTVIQLVFDPACVSKQACVAMADFDIASGCYSAGEYAWAPSFSEAIRTKIMQYLPAGAGSPQRSYLRYLKYNRLGYRIDGSMRQLLKRWREASLGA